MAHDLPHPRASELDLGAVLHALSDATRREVLAAVAASGPQFCGDLDYDVSMSTMSHHLKVLRESGLLHTEVLGNRRRISRRDEAIETAFPGLLKAVGLPSGRGTWHEGADAEETEPDRGPR